MHQKGDKILPGYAYSRSFKLLIIIAISSFDDLFLISSYAQVSAFVSLGAIIISTFCFILSTFPELQDAEEDAEEWESYKMNKIQRQQQRENNSGTAVPPEFYRPFCAQHLYSTFPKYDLLRLKFTVSQTPKLKMLSKTRRSF